MSAAGFRRRDTGALRALGHGADGQGVAVGRQLLRPLREHVEQLEDGSVVCVAGRPSHDHCYRIIKSAHSDESLRISHRIRLKSAAKPSGPDRASRSA